MPRPQKQQDRRNLLDSMMPSIKGLDAKVNPREDRNTTNPADWIQTRLGEHLWSKQRVIVKSVQRHRYTSVKSCHSIGKSYTASRLIAWWLDTKPDPFVVTTAPSGHQVRAILWREIKRAHKRAKLNGRITEGQVPEWKIGNELVAFGRKPADYVDAAEAATAFQGIHALNLLVVLDEASGIPDWLATAVETLNANDNSRVLAIGNPDNPNSWFARTCKPGSDYNVISVSAFDTPAYTHEPIPENLSQLLVSKTWVEERRRRWGENNPLWYSKVLAEFPVLSENTVFTPMHIDIMKATDRSQQALHTGFNYGGADISRLGGDECCVYVNQNGYVRHFASWGMVDTMESVGRIRRLFGNRTWPQLNVDVNGVGGGVYDRLKELHKPVISFNGGERAFRPDKYANRRAESYWEAREAAEKGLIDIDPADEDLQAELLDIGYKVKSTGQIQLEPKDDTRKRLGRSPNRADAFTMALQRRADWIQVFAPELTHPNSEVQPVFIPLQTTETTGEPDDPNHDPDVTDIMEAQL